MNFELFCAIRLCEYQLTSEDYRKCMDFIASWNFSFLFFRYVYTRMYLESREKANYTRQSILLLVVCRRQGFQTVQFSYA